MRWSVLGLMAVGAAALGISRLMPQPSPPHDPAQLLIAAPSTFDCATPPHASPSAFECTALPPTPFTLDCTIFSVDALTALKSSATEKELVERAAALFEAAETSLFAGDEMNLSRAERRLLFCAALSQRLAPYGSGLGKEALLEQVREPRLNCCGYANAAAALFAALEPGRDIVFVGFHGGAAGNHVQLLYPDAQRPWLVDPCAGVAAPVPYDDLLRGTPLSPAKLLVFFDEANQKDIVVHSQQMREALIRGTYRPSDLLYCYRDRIEWLSASTRWPRYVDYLRHLPTPAAPACLESFLKDRPND